MKVEHTLADSERIWSMRKSHDQYNLRDTVTVLIQDLDTNTWRKYQITDSEWINANTELIKQFNIIEQQLYREISKVVRYDRPDPKRDRNHPQPA